MNQKIQNVESPLSQIAHSLIGFLNNGEYVDTTGVAIPHGKLLSPKELINNKNINCNRNMNKKLIRLSESDLHKIVKESVNNTLNEMSPMVGGSDARRNIHLSGEYRRTVQNLVRTLEIVLIS